MKTGDDAPNSLAAGRRLRLVAVYRLAARLLLGYAWLSFGNLFRGAEASERALSRWIRRSAGRVRETILEVKGLFVKVGQLLSALTNVMPAEFRQELEGLQDQIPPRPFAEIRERLRRELGAEPEELFAEIESEPIASASLAQVHGARLRDGRRVAVKVQHLEIEELARLDLATMRRLLGIAQLVLRLRGFTAAFDEVREMILDELDFEREADYIEAIAANFADDPMVACPEVIRERSSRRILTTEFVEGLKITDREGMIAQGIDPGPVAERVVRAYCQMIFIDGIYHADPHPGNILVRPYGGIFFLDFGATAKLSTGLKEGIPRFLEGVLRRDREEILRALAQMGFVARGRDHEIAERVIDYFYSRFLEQVELDSWNLQDLRVDAQMKFEMMADLNRLDVSLGELASVFQVPKEWVLLQRTLALLVGVSTHLHPEMRPVTIVRPYLEEFVFGGERDWRGLATRAIKDMALSVFTIPEDLRRLLAQARRGEARLEVRGVREGASLLYALGHQLLFGGFAVASGFVAYDAAGSGDELLARVFAGIAGISMLLVGTSIWRARRWQRELRRRPRGR